MFLRKDGNRLFGDADSCARITEPSATPP